MNIRDKSSNSKLAPVGTAAALFSPKGKPAITLAVPSVRLPAPALPSHRCPRAPHPWTGCAQGYCYVVRSLKNKSSSPFLLLLRYPELELGALPRWGTKRRGGFGEGGRKKHVLLCAWFCSTWVGTAHGRRLSQPSVSQGMLSCLPRPGAEPLEIPPRRAAPATNITAAPEACRIHCAWACRGLEALRWSPQPTGAWASLQPKEFSLPSAMGNWEEENGKDGVILKAQLPCPQMTWRTAMRVTWLPKLQCNHPRSLTAKLQQK